MKRERVVVGQGMLARRAESTPRFPGSREWRLPASALRGVPQLSGPVQAPVVPTMPPSTGITTPVT